jgi:hypothetical protein
VAARRRIAELEAELAIHRRSAERLAKVVLPKDDSRRDDAVACRVQVHDRGPDQRRCDLM